MNLGHMRFLMQYSDSLPYEVEKMIYQIIFKYLIEALDSRSYNRKETTG